jgi:hypothetical protein
VPPRVGGATVGVADVAGAVVWAVVNGGVVACVVVSVFVQLPIIKVHVINIARIIKSAFFMFYYTPFLFVT